MRLFTKMGISAASAAMVLAMPIGTTAAHADTSNTTNTAILGVAVNGGHNSGILGVACGKGAVNTAILGTAITGHCRLR